ncbi:MAG TPA: PAS domain-containing sensor histidine kinase [Herpetosiphonaceae bacterium]|nr:PAS domain-containing sensor histidine kinase [Herpetosiphonaceae bacterium]
MLEESLEDLYEHAPCGYVSTLLDGTFAKVNQTFLDWTGYQRLELLAGKRFQDLLTVGGKIFYETHFAPLLHMQGFVNEIAFDLVCRDGHRLPVLINSVQKRDVFGTPVLNRTTIFDARDRRKYERELQRARKEAEEALHLRDQFLSLASHELKTPLTSILGNLQLLQRRVDKEKILNVRDQHTLQTIAGQMNRLNKMVHSLFDISRIEAGQLTIERGRVDVRALVSRVVDEIQPTLDGREIEMQASIQSAVIQGDELRLEQVFQNLIQNALKYSPPAAPVWVAVDECGSHVCVEVHDQGIGIPQEALPHLFERFYRAANAQEGRVGGIGIGLYVVKEIVELHGGHVTVESTEGQGSTFTVYLPLA